jgi:ABC-type nitrate/sulfonate/bicarbonate transport system ATPase subunit
VPIVTPSLTQLQIELQKHAARRPHDHRRSIHAVETGEHALEAAICRSVTAAHQFSITFRCACESAKSFACSAVAAAANRPCCAYSPGLAKPHQRQRVVSRHAVASAASACALVFQQASLLPWLDVTGNAGFGLDFSRQPEDRQDDAQQAHCTGNRSRRPCRQRARVTLRNCRAAWRNASALARALAREPELLFADEPFSALDAITRTEMQALLVDVVHRWHTAVLLVTHDIDEAILVADRILLMGGKPGRIVQEWTVDIPRPREGHSAASGATATRYSFRLTRSAT